MQGLLQLVKHSTLAVVQDAMHFFEHFSSQTFSSILVIEQSAPMNFGLQEQTPAAQ